MEYNSRKNRFIPSSEASNVGIKQRLVNLRIELDGFIDDYPNDSQSNNPMGSQLSKVISRMASQQLPLKQPSYCKEVSDLITSLTMLPTTLLFSHANLEVDSCIQNISKFVTSAIQCEQLPLSGRGITKVYHLMLLYLRSRISIGREFLNGNVSSIQSHKDVKNDQYLGNVTSLLDIMEFCNLLITYCLNAKSTQLQCCRHEGLSILLSYCDLTADSFAIDSLNPGKGLFCSDNEWILLQCMSLKSIGIILSQPLHMAEGSSLDAKEDGESCCLHPCSEEELNLFLMNYRDLEYAPKISKDGIKNVIKSLSVAHEEYFSTDSIIGSGNPLFVSEVKDDLSHKSTIHSNSTYPLSSAQHVTTEEREAFKKHRAFALLHLYERGALMLVDTLKKETFSSQKAVYWLQTSSLQRLITCLEALSSALDGYKEECFQLLLHSAESGDKCDSKALFFLHNTSIVQSLYTLFTRVLAPSSVLPASPNVSGGDNLIRPTQTTPSSSSLSTASSSLSATVLDAQAQSFVALSTHSLRLMASIAAYNPSLFMSSWQLFLSDSLAVDKAMQTSVDSALGLIDGHSLSLPFKSTIPSRLPLFVALSSGSEAQGRKEETSSAVNSNHDIDLGSGTTISKISSGQSTKLNGQFPFKFKSILFTAATKGLHPYLISSYYYDQGHDQPVQESPSSISPAVLSQRLSTSQSIKRTIRRLQTPSSHPEVALRCQAVKVLGEMVRGLNLTKWFPPSSSSNLHSSRNANNKVAVAVIKILRFMVLMLHWETDMRVLKELFQMVSAFITAVPLASQGQRCSNRNSHMVVVEDLCTVIIYRIMLLAITDSGSISDSSSTGGFSDSLETDDNSRRSNIRGNTGNGDSRYRPPSYSRSPSTSSSLSRLLPTEANSPSKKDRGLSVSPSSPHEIGTVATSWLLDLSDPSPYSGKEPFIFLLKYIRCYNYFTPYILDGPSYFCNICSKRLTSLDCFSRVLSLSIPFPIETNSHISDALLRFSNLPVSPVPPSSGTFPASISSSFNETELKSVNSTSFSVFENDGLESPSTWRRGRGTRSAARDDRRSGTRNSSNKQSNISSVPSAVTSDEDDSIDSVVLVTCALLLSALCVDQPTLSASSSLPINSSLSIYRSLLLSLSVSYPNALLGRDAYNRCSYQPKYLSTLFLHLKSPKSPTPSPSKQFLYRLLSSLIPHVEIFGSNHDDIKVDSTTSDTDELIGFHLSMRDFMTMVIDGMKDEDHQVRLLSVAVVGQLTASHWRYLAVRHTKSSQLSDSNPKHVVVSALDMMEHLLLSCKDTVGTVRIAGYKAIGDSILNGAMALPLRLETTYRSTMNEGGIQSNDMIRRVETTSPIYEDEIREVNSLILDVLSSLQKGCKDSKLAVRVQATFALGNILQMILLSKRHLQRDTWLVLFKLCRSLLDDSDKILASAVRCLGFLVAAMPKDSISPSSIPCPSSSDCSAKGYEHLQLLRELVGVLIQRGLLYCSATDGKQSIIAGRTHDSSTVEYSTTPAIVDASVYDGLTKVTPLESAISLPSDLEAAVYRALSVGNRSDSQPLKLMFSVCQALGLLGYALLVETRTEGEELLGSKKVLGSNQSNLSNRNDNSKDANHFDYVVAAVDDRLRSHERVLQIITIMTAMLRQGVVKIRYQACKALVSIIGCGVDLNRTKAMGRADGYPPLLSPDKVAGLLEVVIVSATEILAYNSSGTGSKIKATGNDGDRDLHHKSTVDSKDYRSVKNMQRSKASSVADKISALQRSLLILLHLILSIIDCTSDAIEQVLSHHIDELMGWLEHMDGDSTVLKVTNVMLDISSNDDSNTNECLLAITKYPTPRTIGAQIALSVLRIMNTSVNKISLSLSKCDLDVPSINPKTADRFTPSKHSPNRPLGHNMSFSSSALRKLVLLSTGDDECSSNPYSSPSQALKTLNQSETTDEDEI